MRCHQCPHPSQPAVSIGRPGPGILGVVILGGVVSTKKAIEEFTHRMLMPLNLVDEVSGITASHGGCRPCNGLLRATQQMGLGILLILQPMLQAPPKCVGILELSDLLRAEPALLSQGL